MCRSIEYYLRRAAEVGECGARALRRGVTCLLPRSRETGRAGPRLRAPRSCMWRGSRGEEDDDQDAPIDFSTDAWRAPMYRDPLEELTPTQRLGIRSVESRHHTEVTFRNATKGKARLFWLNYWGDEIAYKTLAPGQMHTQQTFETHPWTFATFSDDDDEGETRRRRLVTDGGAAVFWPTRSEEEIAADDVDGGRAALRRRRERLRAARVPPDPGRVCAIREPASTPWTREAHATKFPLFFRLACRELVLSHARLRDADRTAPAAPERRFPSGDDDVRDAKRFRGDGVGRGVGSSAAVELGPAGPEDEDDDGGDDAGGEPATTLGDLPADVVAYIVELAAPIVPAYEDVRISSATLEGTASRGPGPVFG